MLIKCPECDLQVSDKAISCPHCGYPLNQNINQTRPYKRHKHRRLPNGFGQISEIKNQNLRNPYRAMITVGKTPEGRPICKPLKPQSYFATYNEAYEALVEYNRNPYDLDPGLTVKELYEKWFNEYSKKYDNISTLRSWTTTWAYCSSLYNMKVSNLRARHIKGCIEDAKAVVNGQERRATAPIKARIKSLFNLMLDYAIEYEIVDRNCARTFNISQEITREKNTVKKSHMAFSDEEMQKLWDNLEKYKYIDIILIQCYSGWRPQELGLIELQNVDLDNWTFTGGMKTKSGTDRVVPIHTKIRKLVEKRYDEAKHLKSKYLLNCVEGRNDRRLSYDKYRQRFDQIVKKLDLNQEHRPHDCRVQFVTMAKKYNIDEYAIKYMVGHAINDITERVYTKRDTEWLQSEIEKIK